MAEIRPEALERLPHTATFSKVELMVALIPGHNRCGAVVKGFINAIHTHDSIVQEVEEVWRRVDENQRAYNKINKIYRNMDAFFYVCNSSPEDLAAFEDQLPRMTNIKDRLALIADKTVRESVLAEYRAFRRTQKKFERLVGLRVTLDETRRRRDDVQTQLVLSRSLLSDARSREDAASNLISQDHLLADEKRLTLHEMFPNVHVGHVMTEINGTEVELMPFAEVLDVIRFAASPHRVTFRPHHFSFDLVRGRWVPLQERRALNVYVEDPIIKVREFFLHCRAGDTAKVALELRCGADPNSFDATLTTALHVAAANGHEAVVRLLVSSGARLEARDKNMATPLLAAVKKGVLPLARLLLELGADRNVSDRMHRSAAYFASLSGNLDLARLFVDARNCNTADNIWGRTPLHVGAERGDGDFVRFLMGMDASIYARDKDGRTPEELAAQAGHREVEAFLREQRFDAPGQLATTLTVGDDATTSVWIGDHSAFESPSWLAHAGITSVVCLVAEDGQQWPSGSPSDVTVSFVGLDCDDDDESEASWLSLSARLAELLATLEQHFSGGGHVLLCDATGFSTCAAVLSAYLLLRRQTRFEAAELLLCQARPSVYMSVSHKKGLRGLQARLDGLRMKRLDSKLRTSPMVSIAF